MVYVTIATTGNSLNFGNLTQARAGLAACASSTRGVFAGGSTNSSGNAVDTIDYITIASTGAATDFGDLVGVRFAIAGCSSGAAAVQPTPTSSEIALIGGGENSAPLTQTVIQYINIATTSNTYMFSGGLTQQTYDAGGCASSTRFLIGGGTDGTGTRTNVISYGTFSTFGQNTDFGDLTTIRSRVASCSNSTRGVWAGGILGPSNVIDYVTIATTGNATDFGDMTQATQWMTGCASTTRGLFGGGFTSVTVNIIEYITIASASNATDFGDLTAVNYAMAACASSTRGIFAGGASPNTNVIAYVTIATTGNATDFGDLTDSATSGGMAGASSSTRGVFGGGSGSANNIQYITIASTGNAIDFGDLQIGVNGLAGASNCHGGI
jgi:hypothetical protein